MTFRRINPLTLQRLIESTRPPLVLDVRRREAFGKLPYGVPGAVPLLLDQRPLQLPDLGHSHPIAVYCL